MYFFSQAFLLARTKAAGSHFNQFSVKFVMTAVNFFIAVSILPLYHTVASVNNCRGSRVKSILVKKYSSKPIH